MFSFISYIPSSGPCRWRTDRLKPAIPLNMWRNSHPISLCACCRFQDGRCSQRRLHEIGASPARPSPPTARTKLGDRAERQHDHSEFLDGPGGSANPVACVGAGTVDPGATRAWLIDGRRIGESGECAAKPLLGRRRSHLLLSIAPASGLRSRCSGAVDFQPAATQR